MLDSATLVNISAFIVFALGIAKAWYASQSNLRPLYYTMIAMAAVMSVINYLVVIEAPQFLGINLFHVLNFWTALMGIRGLIRLKGKR